MNRLTRQEQYVLAVTLALLLTGLMVKAWRSAHAPGTPAAPAATRS